MTDRSQWAAMPLKCTLLSAQEFREREDARRANVDDYRKAHPDLEDLWTDELQAQQRTFLPPGSMWFCPWYFDPAKPEDIERLPRLLAKFEEPGFNGFLSIHYLKDWARQRPPICVVCPDYRHWIPDQKSSNGTGWTVTGEAPTITCSPSIWTRMSEGDAYHGYLQNGVFTVPV